MFFANGEYYIGMFKHNNYNGLGKMFNRNHKIEIGYFKDNIYVGIKD